MVDNVVHSLKERTNITNTGYTNNEVSNRDEVVTHKRQCICFSTMDVSKTNP